MIISTLEELRLYLPTHVMTDIDNMRGAINNSQNDFLRERLGNELATALNDRYQEKYIDEDGNPDEEAIRLNIIDENRESWDELIVLAQRCVVFDAFSRMADIQAVSVNDAGINVVDTKGYDAAKDKTVSNYKAQMQREAHAASNRLLIQLEDWQKYVASLDGESGGTEDDEIMNIVSLWQRSEYYYYADGLLINTATDFNLFVNIYDSREKFIQLLPDLRYCQETHIEAEIGEELLADLIQKHKDGKLSAVEQKAYTRLQRTISLQVEARSPIFKRPEAKDEAAGHMRMTIDYIRKHQSDFDEDAMKASPLYVAPVATDAPTPSHHAPHHDLCHHGPHRDGEMLVTSII